MKKVTMTMGLWWVTCAPAFAAMNENSMEGCLDADGSNREEFTDLDNVCNTVEGKKECPDLDDCEL